MVTGGTLETVNSSGESGGASTIGTEEHGTLTTYSDLDKQKMSEEARQTEDGLTPAAMYMPDVVAAACLGCLCFVYAPSDESELSSP